MSRSFPPSLSRRSAPEEEEGILRYFVFLCYLARFALYIPPLCLRQRLPGLATHVELLVDSQRARLKKVVE